MKKPLFFLGCGWTLALSSFALRAAVLDPVTGAPDPSDPGVVLWLDSSDAGTLFQDVAGTVPAADGAAVAHWKDKSQLGLIFTQSSPGNTPLYTASAPDLGGGPVVSFVGGTGGDALTSTTGNSTGILGADPMTVVTIYRSTGFTSQNYQHTFHIGAPANFRSYGHSASRALNVGAASIGNHYWGDGFNSAVVANTDPNFVLSSYDGITDYWYINGAFAGKHPVVLDLAPDQIQVGSRLTPYIEGFTGDMAEVILFDVVLTDVERELLGMYVQNKYGIAVGEAPEPGFPVIVPTTGAPNPSHPDLRLWLDSSDAATLWQDVDGTGPAADGLPVARWDDKSLKGIRVTQPTVGNAPVLTGSVTTLNDLPGVTFAGGNGIGDALTSTTANSTGVVGVTELTLVTVWQSTGFVGTNFQHSFHMGDATTRQAYGHSVSRGGNLGSGIGNHYWAGEFNNTAVFANTDPNMALSSYDGIGVDTWWVNGIPGGAANILVSIGGEQLQVGSRIAPFTEGLTGHLAEVILIASVLTDDERNALGFYIQNKYGFPIQDSGLAVLPALAFTSIDVDVDGMSDTATVTLGWTSNVSGSFRVEYSDDFILWQELTDNEAGIVGDNIYEHIFPDASMVPTRHYRISLIDQGT